MRSRSSFGALCGSFEHIERRMREGTYRKSYLQARLREARSVIDQLVAIQDGQVTGEVMAWARQNIPSTYQLGAGLAVRDLRAQGVSPVPGPGRIHARAVEALLAQYEADAVEIVVQLNANVIRASRLVLAQAGFGEEIAAGIIGGLPRRETSRLLKRALRDAVRSTGAELEDGDLSQVEINGRTYRVDVWAEMHARTRTAQASTAGTRGMCAANDVGYVQVTTHAHAPCICTPFEGRIYALQEGDDRFPWVGILPNGGCPMHPNCVHREAPAVLSILEARGEVDGRDTVPEDFRGLTPTELARTVREHSTELAKYSQQAAGMLPADFQLRNAA